MAEVLSGTKITIPDWFKSRSNNCGDCESVAGVLKKAKKWMPTAVEGGKIKIRCYPGLYLPDATLITQASHNQSSRSSFEFPTESTCPITEDHMETPLHPISTTPRIDDLKG